MTSRKTFINSIGLMGSMLILPQAFAGKVNKEKPLKPLLADRNKANSYWYIGHLMSILLSSRETNGKYAMIRATERRGLEPPPHIHTREDETFLILEGEAIYTVGEESFHAKMGDVMFLPRNIQHSFKIQTDILETMILLTPGGLENYFVEMSTPAAQIELPPMPSGPPDVKKIIATASKYGVKFPRP